MPKVGDLVGQTLALDGILMDVNTNKRLFYNDQSGHLRILADNGRAKEMDAIVDAAGDGDYRLISEAITAGEQNIFVRNGTYTETSQITISTGTQIRGESALQTIIVGSGLSVPLFNFTNGSTIEFAGTLAVTNGSTGIVGTGTTFTNLSVGDTIMIGQLPYTIATITDNTNLTINESYNGTTVSGITYMAGKFLETAIFINFTITNSTVDPCTGGAICANAIQQFVLQNMVVTGFVDNVCVISSIMVIIQNTLTKTSTGAGLIFTDIFNGLLVACGFANNTGNGLTINGTSPGSTGIIVDECVFTNNGSNGVQISNDATIINFTNSQIQFNSVNGVRSDPSSSRVIVDQCNVNDNGNGINFDGNLNIVNGCVISSNTGFGIKVGDEGLIVGNNISNNTSFGIDMQSDINNTVTGNIIHDNSDSGIRISGNTSLNTITGNTIFSNTNSGINMTGSGGGNNTVSGNVIRGNSLRGIRVNSDDNCITGNAIASNPTGILIETGATDNLVVGNHTANSTTGITDNGTTTLVANNK